MLKAGIKRVEITPPLGLGLEGYPHYPRHNTGAHDPLHATCMYLADGGAQVALVTLDLVAVSKKYVAEIRRRLFDKCGIAAKDIMISASHTHSGPCAADLDNIEDIETGKAPDPDYVEFLISTVVNAVADAKASAFDAYFGTGIAICGAECGVGGNRRMPGGPHDPIVSVLAVKDMADTVRGVMVNYTLHPTFIHEWSNVCTADYPAYVKVQLEEEYTSCVTGFSQGCSGNQSSRYYRQGESFDEAERVGRAIGKAAISVVESIAWTNELTIKTASTEVEVKLRNFGTEEELEAQVAIDKARYEELYAKYGSSENRDEYLLWQNANLKMLGSENQLGYGGFISKGRDTDGLLGELPAEVHIVRLGDTCVVGVQGEVFVEYGLYIKAMAGFGTVIINELTNGNMPGYLYTPESLTYGGYETDTSMLDISYGKKLVDTVLDTVELIK